MPEAVANWDEVVLGTPALAEYRIERPLLGLRSANLTASPIWRQVARNRSRLITATVIQTAAQFAAFESFFSTTLDAGQGWFTVAIYGPNGPLSGLGHIERYEPSPVGRGFTHSKTAIVMDWMA